ncbi:MAG: GNAT family N-acetyltransferase [Gemmatimonadetes bacterium]|nr:GNAT family N-acetyltransferase [Gemmatimonadota bacterium]MBT8404757.1 GNAT family N-acetyltransferase [Gemmatimonadota bacterium]NNF38197.1 GNAT family N-acetyltransferase [Gemmatimonadota bacterium]NNK62411.1 GNAT family N-acetyltransferase [Gemmatimonadota bacterium]
MTGWVRAGTPAEFFDRCRDFLMASEAEHNLILGLGPGLISGEHAFRDPIYLAWYEVDGAVVGYAFRTPPFKVSVSALPASAIPELADHLGRIYGAIPAVLGPERSAQALADAWTARHGGRTVPGMRLRIHALHQVRDDLPAASGRMRSGTPDDRELTAAWLARFASETGIPDTDPKAQAGTMIAQDRIRLWEDDGRVVSMAARAGMTSTSVRVGYVYTPPDERGKGYATALVADLTREVLASGRRSAFLYTDLANPTSNAIYARIGYVPVCDVVDVEIRTAS